MPVERDDGGRAVLTDAPHLTTVTQQIQFYGPEGTTDYDTGVLDIAGITTRTRYAQVSRRLAAWEAENDVILIPRRYMTLGQSTRDTGGAARVPSSYHIRVATALSSGYRPYFATGECPNPHCNTLWDASRAQCPGCGLEIRCSGCNSMYVPPENLGYLVGGTFGCVNCYSRCNAGCGRVAGRSRRCYHHSTITACTDCGAEMEQNDHLPLNAQVCSDCIALRCTECGERSEELERIEAGNLCLSCATEWHSLHTENAETDVLYHEEVLLTSFPNRPIRLVSIEQEFQAPERNENERVGDSIATDLHVAGLANWPDMMRYHCGTHSKLCHVESDSSVAYGGELILNRLRLDDPNDVTGLMTITEVMETYRNEGRISFDVSCGTHIHADLHGYTIQDARNLVIMYSHLEDVIFRFGSAGYQDHRSIINNSTYARPIHKGTWNNNREFGVQFLRNAGHEDSLNMQHFYASLRACKCGAIEFGTIEECECVRPKCTAEWRVFNGTSNPSTIMAYVSFVQSITAWCQGRSLDPTEWETLAFEQGISFVGGNLQNSHNNLINAWRPRVQWIFENLQFSGVERANILNTMKRSPLRYLGEEFFEEMHQIEGEYDGHQVQLGVCPHRGVSVQSPNSSLDEYCYDCDTSARFCECGNYDPVPEDDMPFTAPRYFQDRDTWTQVYPASTSREES